MEDEYLNLYVCCASMFPLPDIWAGVSFSVLSSRISRTSPPLLAHEAPRPGGFSALCSPQISGASIAWESRILLPKSFALTISLTHFRIQREIRHVEMSELSQKPEVADLVFLMSGPASIHIATLRREHILTGQRLLKGETRLGNEG